MDIKYGWKGMNSEQLKERWLVGRKKRGRGERVGGKRDAGNPQCSSVA